MALKVNQGKLDWTDELIARLRDLWGKGVPTSQIARLLGPAVTKNMVIGKAHRLKLSRRKSPITHPRGVSRPLKARPPRPSRAKGAPDASLPLPVPEPPPPPPVPPARPPPPPRPIPPRKKPGTFTLLDLRPHECKWPVNDPPRGQGDRYLFCGQPQFDGQAYCEYHCRVGFSGKGTARAPERAGWQPRQAGF
jgi:GcrA cell cycle regulator